MDIFSTFNDLLAQVVSAKAVEGAEAAPLPQSHAADDDAMAVDSSAASSVGVAGTAARPRC